MEIRGHLSNEVSGSGSVIYCGGSALASLAGLDLLRAPTGRAPWAGHFFQQA